MSNLTLAESQTVDSEPRATQNEQVHTDEDFLYGDFFDEEKEYEKHMDHQHFLRHGGDPWWAQ